MKRIRVTPKSREEWLRLRWHNINSTESSRLFGLNPYATHCALWFEKKNKPESFDDDVPSTRMIWGTRLQDAIAKGVAEDQGWKIKKLNQYIHIPELRMGSSFDCEIINKEAGHGVLEIKNVSGSAYRDNWRQGEVIMPPDYISIQAQHQLEVINREWAYIAALVGGNEVCLIRVERDREIGELIKEKIREFWASIEADEPPHPVNSEDALRRWPFGIDGKATTSTQEVLTAVEQLRELRFLRTELDAEAEAVELQIKEALGDAEALVDSNGSPICTWRSSTRSSIDTTALKAEMPEIAARFTKESSTRVFRLNKSKEILL